MKRGDYVLVRTYSAGVHYGVLESHKGQEVVLRDARRLWQWVGAFTLHAVAKYGIGKGSKISVTLPEILLTQAIELMPISEAAEKVLRDHPESKP